MRKSPVQPPTAFQLPPHFRQIGCQLETHQLKTSTELSQLILPATIQSKIQVIFRNLFSRQLQLRQRRPQLLNPKKPSRRKNAQRSVNRHRQRRRQPQPTHQTFIRRGQLSRVGVNNRPVAQLLPLFIGKVITHRRPAAIFGQNLFLPPIANTVSNQA